MIDDLLKLILAANESPPLFHSDLLCFGLKWKPVTQESLHRLLLQYDDLKHTSKSTTNYFNECKLKLLE